VKKRWLRKRRIGLGGLLLLLALFKALAAQDPGLQLGAPFWSNGQVRLTLTGEAGVSYVIESSPDLQNWAPVLTNSDPAITRVIPVGAPDRQSFYRASRGLLPLFAFALAARRGIDLKGNNVAIDSFDSADPNYSTGGLYDPAKRKDNGDVVTDDTMVNSLTVGNGRIMGHARTGLGTNTVSLGPVGAVGSKAWVQSGVQGIEPGWAADDLNISWPDAQLPFTGGAFTPSGGWITNVSTIGTNITYYDYILGDGNYQVSNLSGSVYVQGDAVLLVTGSATSNSIVIANGKSLQFYNQAPRYSLSGALAVNANGTAAQFAYYGLPGNTNVSVIISGGSVGTIYAPDAALSLGGGGNTTQVFVGAAIADTINLNGHFELHFDEDLIRNGPSR